MRASTDAGPGAGADHVSMDRSDEQARERAREVRNAAARRRTEEERVAYARLRAAEDRELYAIRRTEVHMVAEERSLTFGLERLEAEIHRVDVAIEEEWHVEHWGRPSPPPPSWRATPPPRHPRAR